MINDLIIWKNLIYDHWYTIIVYGTVQKCNLRDTNVEIEHMGEPKWTREHRKGAKSEPRGSQRAPKGSQREPKVSQIQHKINIKEWVAKMSSKWSPHQDEMGAFWKPFSIENWWTNRCENRYRRSHENWWIFDVKIKPDLDTFRRRRSWKNVFFGKGECT